MRGGPKASTHTVPKISERFTTLNPYSFGGTILKVEAVNCEDGDPSKPFRDLYGYAIRAKRYSLTTRNQSRITCLTRSVSSSEMSDMWQMVVPQMRDAPTFLNQKLVRDEVLEDVFPVGVFIHDPEQLGKRGQSQLRPGVQSHPLFLMFRRFEVLNFLLHIRWNFIPPIDRVQL